MIDPAQKFFVTALQGPASGKEFLIVGNEVRIGRTEDNDIVLPETNISRRHALLWVDRGNLWIKDEQSKNGVFVNQQRVTTTSLHAGDLVQLGLSVLRVGTEVVPDALPEAIGARLKPQFDKMVEKFSIARNAILRLGPRRIALYSAALAVSYVALSTSKPPTSLKLAPAVVSEKPFAMTFSTLNVPSRASDEEIVAWRTRAQQALRFNDLPAAIPLLQNVISARPSDAEARSQLSGAQKRLSDLVRRYSESGAREYEKKYYEKAIQEWQKVLSLTDGLDAETYRRTEERVHEIQTHLAQKR